MRNTIYNINEFFGVEESLHDMLWFYVPNIILFTIAVTTFIAVLSM